MSELAEVAQSLAASWISGSRGEPEPPLTWERGVTAEGFATLKRNGRCRGGCCGGFVVVSDGTSSHAARCPACGNSSAAADRFNAAMFPTWVHNAIPEWRDVAKVTGRTDAISLADCEALAASMWAGGPGCCWYGSAGRGKSVLAAVAALAWLRLGGACRWVSWTEVLGGLKDAIAKGEPLKPHVARLVGAHLLIVDDVKERATEWTGEVAEAVIGARADLKRPMLITSNLGPAKFQRALGDRTWSRLSRACDLAEVVGEDLRKLG